MSKVEGLSSRYLCDVCGKVHYRNQKSIFKMTYGGKTRHFCGYNCYNKIQKLIKEKNYEEVDKIFDSNHGESRL